MGHRMASEIRIILMAVAALAAAAFLIHNWAAQAAVIHGAVQMTAPVELQQAQLQHAQVRSLAGASLRVAVGF